jgi:Ca2+-binding EF-hand superfamily protein
MSWKSTIALAAAAGFAAATLGGAALAADSDQNLAAGETQAKQLLLLMDKDQNGKVSKREFMNFMAAEFARLDTNKDGELDVSELNEAQLRGFGNKKPGGR